MTLPGPIEALIDRMDSRPQIRAAIRAHLLAQVGLPAGRVKLADGRIVPIGETDDDDRG